MLGVARRADAAAIKRAYRALALRVHPDKNPDERAPAAFKALQDAYNTLQSPERRAEHNGQLRRARAVRRERYTRVAREAAETAVAHIKYRARDVPPPALVASAVLVALFAL